MPLGPSAADILERNSQYAQSHEPIPTFQELAAMGAPSPQVLIITCADPRVIPEKFFNLGIGDALVVRNACGHVEPVMGNIIGVDSLLNLSAIMIVHHTDCGALAYNKDDHLRTDLKKKFPSHAAEIDNLYFGNITDLEQSVRDNLAVLRKTQFIREELRNSAKGYIYDIKTGKVTEVKS